MKNHKVARRISLLGLTISCITCMIGSGWLFGAFIAARIAGPAAIFAWLVGGIAILIIALTYVELGAMIPKVGGMVRYMQYTHGSLAGFIMAWANWLAIATVIPVEALASVQYMSSWPWHWAQVLFIGHHHGLSDRGLLLASALILVYFLINYWSVLLFIRFVIVITLLKMIVPLLTIILLWYSAFHAHNFVAYGNTMVPYGLSSIFTAVATSGIIFAFHGFQTAVNLSGEAKRPGRNVPLAIIISILFALAVYLLLQAVFIGAISPDKILQGWHQLDLRSPFVGLALALNLNFLVILLYLDAFVSPTGTAATYMATTTRMLYGMSKSGYMPKFMSFLHPVYRIPRMALWANLLVSLIFLWVYRGWAHLVPIVSLTAIVAYITGPVSVTALRHLAAQHWRPVKLPFLRTIAASAFVIISLVLYWARWPLTGEVVIIVLMGLIVYVYYQTKSAWVGFLRQLKSGIWIILYLFAIALISYLGSQQFGGRGIIPNGWSMPCVVVVALLFYVWGVKSAWLTPELEEMLTTQRFEWRR